MRGFRCDLFERLLLLIAELIVVLKMIKITEQLVLRDSSTAIDLEIFFASALHSLPVGKQTNVHKLSEARHTCLCDRYQNLQHSHLASKIVNTPLCSGAVNVHKGIDRPHGTVHLIENLKGLVDFLFVLRHIGFQVKLMAPNSENQSQQTL